MGRMFGLLTIVLGAWVSLTLYQEGLDNAFGGLLSGAATPGVENSQPITRRIGQAAEAAHRSHEERMNRQLADLEP